MFRNKWISISMTVIIALALLALGFWLGRTFDGTENTAKRMMPNQEELAAMKAQIDEDEAGYTAYKEFSQFPAMYRKAPDRIWFKPADEDFFYLFEPQDTDYEHLLQVIEDRMYYSTLADHNLYCFSPDSAETMLTSGHRYVVLDHNNVGSSRYDEQYEYDLIFNFGEDTRLYRLLRYLSYFKEPIAPDELPEEFSDRGENSGYKYMNQRKPEPEYPKEKDGIYWLDVQFGYQETVTVESLSITTDGGKTFQKAVAKEKAKQIALEEAQKEQYKYQGPDCSFTKAEENVELIVWSDTLPSPWTKEWAAKDTDDHHILWSVRLFDENDPLCSLYLYIDAYTGKVIGGGELSD